MKQARPIATFVATMAQRIYENNRVPETWGSPSVSRLTFERLRREGFWVAGRYLLQRLQETGRSDLSTVEKLTALMAGVIIVTLANTFLRQEQRPKITVRAARTFSSRAPKFPVALYTLGATLLVAASGGGSGGGDGGGGEEEGERDWSYPGSETSTDYQAYRRPDEDDGRRKRWNPDDWDDWSPEYE
ncbi:MAG: hypothetical protein JOZ71_01530 [Ktedonobacteraceae bacterium]|nr:hypothetical protein [Ktedonobacteraceae bacterium]MBV9019374.1 hypothetical protein [Ktedonobacteraceae bacterium]